MLDTRTESLEFVGYVAGHPMFCDCSGTDAEDVRTAVRDVVRRAAVAHTTETQRLARDWMRAECADDSDGSLVGFILAALSGAAVGFALGILWT